MRGRNYVHTRIEPARTVLSAGLQTARLTFDGATPNSDKSRCIIIRPVECADVRGQCGNIGDISLCVCTTDRRAIDDVCRGGTGVLSAVSQPDDRPIQRTTPDSRMSRQKIRVKKIIGELVVVPLRNI